MNAKEEKWEKGEENVEEDKREQEKEERGCECITTPLLMLPGRLLNC